MDPKTGKKAKKSQAKGSQKAADTKREEPKRTTKK